MTQIDQNQGNVKSSEVGMDSAQPILDTSRQEDTNTVVDQLTKVTSDALVKQSGMLSSIGQISWSGLIVSFDISGVYTNVYYRLFQLTDNNRTIELRLVGAAANSLNRFNNFTLNANEIAYLLLNRQAIINDSLSNYDAIRGVYYVEVKNGISGGSTATDYVLTKTTFAAGIPKLFSAQDNSSTATLNIPLCYRLDYTWNAGSYQDIHWVPHGIRWPAGTTSSLGAIIVEGQENYVDYFVKTEAELVSALIGLSNGGVICVTAPITVNQSITLPSHTQLIGKGSIRSQITMGSGFTINTGYRSIIKDLRLNSASNVNPTSIVTMGSTGTARIENCMFYPTNSSGQLNCITVSGSNHRIINCNFDSVSVSSIRTGVNYSSGSNNADIDSIFT